MDDPLGSSTVTSEVSSDEFRVETPFPVTFDRLSMTSIDREKVAELCVEGNSVKFLMIGRSGSGKSTLANGITGVKVDQATAIDRGAIRRGSTTAVVPYQVRKDNIELIVWDTPGLHDGSGNQEDYLEQIKEQCIERDLTIYCIPICQARFVSGHQNPEVPVMEALTNTFGEEFWKNTIIVLTFANTLEALNVHWETLSRTEKADAFKAKVQEWVEQIQHIMIEDIEVPEEIVRAINIVPGGYYEKHNLPGYEYWLSKLWYRCLDTIPSPEVKAALIQLRRDRLVEEDDLQENAFRDLIQNQPIVFSKHRIIKILGATGGAAAGTVVGAAVGAGLGALTGPLAPLTMPAGAILGAMIGVSIPPSIAYAKLSD